MGRVEGDNGAIASSTNSCGTALLCLTANRVSSSGKKAVLRRGFDMGVRIQRFLCRGTVELLCHAPSVASSRCGGDIARCSFDHRGTTGSVSHPCVPILLVTKMQMVPNCCKHSCSNLQL